MNEPEMLVAEVTFNINLHF